MLTSRRLVTILYALGTIFSRGKKFAYFVLADCTTHVPILIYLYSVMHAARGQPFMFSQATCFSNHV
jgi:hypothetical protein